MHKLENTDRIEATQQTNPTRTIHVKQTIQQLRRAGYKVGKASKQKPMTDDELDRLLDELS